MGQVSEKCDKAYGVRAMIKRNSPKLTSKCKLVIYKSLILPIIVYAPPCWQSNMTGIRCLERVQKTASRWITECGDYLEGLKKANDLSLSFYLQISDLLMMSKIVRNNYDINLQNKLTFEQASAATRFAQRTRFLVLVPKRKLAEANFWIRTPRLIKRIEQDFDFFNSHDLEF